MNTWLTNRNSIKTIGLLLILAIFITACGGPAAPEPATQPAGDETTSETTATNTDEPAAGDTEDTATISDTIEETQTEPVTDTQDEADEPTEPVTDTAATDDQETEQSSESSANGNGNAPLKTDYLEFGVVPHLYYTDYERALQLTQNAGFDWIRQQVVWKDMEMFEPEKKYVWDQLDPIVEAANNYNLKLMISIVQSPEQYNPQHGLPENPEDLGNFVEAMVQRYGDKIQAYEIWNEQNLAHETGGRIAPEDVGHYVEILMECYTRIKAINPDIYVLAGAPSTTGFTREDVALADLDYYRAMYSYKDGIIDGYFDVQAVHPAGSANPPDTIWPDNPSDAEGWTDDSTFYYRHIEHVREIMEEYGLGDHQIWITEYGWATENTSPGYEFGNQVTFEEQAEYITGAMQRTYEEYPWVGVMFLWNLNFAVTWNEHLSFLQQKENITDEEQEMIDLFWNEDDPAQPLHEQASFGILSGDWTPRPAYSEVQRLIAEIKQEQGRE
jgi:ABC-type Fe3+-hydroxamate transport system substrate-binding protein